ncbi:hypothetical protein NE236_42415 [Actinoallomurus purpureus]|uniref:hypothetical protein n=1 Tax=Actinoallomurus purpureus TaxID=478114 RepID=UPI002093EAB1|nr:hypothetical protein [Actinoallomurus purpureus]MCO6011625.1 hypothetical protein [Actinoallomurus purpureus]
MSEDNSTPPQDDAQPGRPDRWHSLPERPHPEDLQAEHRDPAVPGSVLDAPDAEKEFFIRHAT